MNSNEMHLADPEIPAELDIYTFNARMANLQNELNQRTAELEKQKKLVERLAQNLTDREKALETYGTKVAVLAGKVDILTNIIDTALAK